MTAGPNLVLGQVCIYHTEQLTCGSAHTEREKWPHPPLMHVGMCGWKHGTKEPGKRNLRLCSEGESSPTELCPWASRQSQPPAVRTRGCIGGGKGAQPVPALGCSLVPLLSNPLYPHHHHTHLNFPQCVLTPGVRKQKGR